MISHFIILKHLKILYTNLTEPKPPSQIYITQIEYILEHFVELHSLDLSILSEISNEMAASIAKYGKKLKKLNLDGCDDLTDRNIITISKQCVKLQCLILRADYSQMSITNEGIISISEHCSELKELTLENCCEITDVSIISLSQHCIGLQSIDLSGCQRIRCWYCIYSASLLRVAISESCLVTLSKEMILIIVLR